jgi:hypothetical protein
MNNNLRSNFPQGEFVPTKKKALSYVFKGGFQGRQQVVSPSSTDTK